MQATTSHDLAERVKAGDQAAFSLLYARCRPRLALLIHFRLGPRLRAVVEVDDVLQEVFLRAFQDLASFEYRGPGSLLRWLSTIADRVVKDLARFQARQKRRPLELLRLRSPSNPGGPEPAVTLTPSRILAQGEAVAALLRRLDELPEQYREAILLAKVAGWSTREVGELLGKSPEGAALLLHRALKRLRELDQSPPKTA